MTEVWLDGVRLLAESGVYVVPEQRDWSRKIAAWGPSLDAAFEAFGQLIDRGWALLGEPRIRVSGEHADYFPRVGEVFVIEQRVLPLAIPNPMPRLRLFAWRRR